MKFKKTKLLLLGLSSALIFGGVSYVANQAKALEVKAEEDPIYSYYSPVTDSVLQDSTKLFSTLQSIQWNAFKGNTKGYSALWGMYRFTDAREDGKVRDYYSNISNFEFTVDQDGQGKTGDAEGTVYNREHSIPKSWWGGGTDAGTPSTDIFIVVPTDKKVNSQRGAMPYGETDGNTYKSANSFSKVGTNKVDGFSGVVFEPNDIYKGFFARTYFYAVATWCEGKYTTTTGFQQSYGTNVFSSSYQENFGLTSYAKNLFYRWHSEHPVTEWEIARNEACYVSQGNRNPFIDHPEYADILWGNGSSATQVVPTGVTLSKSSITINKDASETILATVSPTSATNKGVIWTSSDDSIAVVKGGVVTGKKAGQATITATTSIGAKVATCSVTVNEDPIELKSISVENMALKVGYANDLVVSFNPANAYPVPKLTFSSNKPNIASVNRKGEVAAKATGSATITVTATQGEVVKTATANITVSAQSESRLKSVYETALALQDKSETSATYEYTGFVTGVLGPHFYVQDNDYAMLVYNFEGHNVEVGQEVTVVTNLKNYGGTPESGSKLISVTPTGNTAKVLAKTITSATEMNNTRVNTLIEFPSIKYTGRNTSSERNNDIMPQFNLGGNTFQGKIAGQNSSEDYYKYSKAQVLTLNKSDKVNLLNVHRTVYQNKAQLELSSNSKISITAEQFIASFIDDITEKAPVSEWENYANIYANLNEEQRLIINDYFNGNVEPEGDAKTFVDLYDKCVKSGKYQAFLVDEEGGSLGPQGGAGMPTWLLIVIIVAGVAVLGGGAATAVIILKKKKAANA